MKTNTMGTQPKFNNYDRYQPSKQSDHSRKVTIGDMKAERTRIRNERRAVNGLPPIPYAQSPNQQ